MADETSGNRARSSEEIRREIERTRADMDETVDALGERLSPGKIVDELWARLRQGDGLSSVGEVVREHPVPLALMGLGLGWLAVERATGGSEKARRVGPGTWARAEGRRGPYGSDAVRHDDPEWPHTGSGAQLKARVAGMGERLSEAKESVTEAMHGAADAVTGEARDLKARASAMTQGAQERASHQAHELRERTTDAAHSIADATREGAQRVRHGFWDLLEESPMVVGAIAFGIGIASGLAAPTTPVEDRLMGRASDTLRDEAKRVAGHTAESAKKVAENAAEAARVEVSRVREEEGETAHSAVDALGDAAKRVVASAKEAARETAEEENLTPDALAEEAKRAAAQTGDALKRSATAQRRRSEGKVGKGTT